MLRRVEALSQDNKTESVSSVGHLELNPERLVAKWRDTPVDLTVTEFALIECLAKNPGQVRSRQQLMDAANLVLDDQTITAHVKRIRAKFLTLDDSFGAIQTVYGLGYRWMDDLLY